MTRLERAISIAVEAHSRQVDKNGEPYILHPIRVMLAVKKHGVSAMIVGVLHDVLDDTTTMMSTLIEKLNLTNKELVALYALTRYPETETYAQYIKHIGTIPLARVVKIADIQDNMLPERTTTDELKGMVEKRYKPALKVLTTIEKDLKSESPHADKRGEG